MTYPNLTNEEIQKLRDVISNTLGNMKKDIRKDKLKVFGKTLLSLLIIAGGVAVTVIFPNPITIGVLGGAATLIAQNSGVFGKIKKIKEKSKEKKKNKEEAENMRIEQSDHRWASRVETLIDKKQTEQLSAPPSYYPDSKQF